MLWRGFEKKFYAYKNHLTQFLKMGSIPSWVQLHAYPKKTFIFLYQMTYSYGQLFSLFIDES